MGIPIATEAATSSSAKCRSLPPRICWLRTNRLGDASRLKSAAAKEDPKSFSARPAKLTNSIERPAITNPGFRAWSKSRAELSRLRPWPARIGGENQSNPRLGQLRRLIGQSVFAFAALKLRRGSLARFASEGWWGKKDSNLRSHKTADLQSAPFATRDTPPLKPHQGLVHRNGGDLGFG
jgi:hypothetical protein